MSAGYKNSPQVPPHDQNAAIEACITSFFSTVAEIKLVANRDSIPPDHQFEKSITTIVNFKGVEQGFLALNISAALAHALVIRMLGDIEELNDSCLLSTLGETANILTHSLLEGLTEKHLYRTSIPATIRDDKSLVQKLLSDKRGYTCILYHEAERLLVKFVIHPPDCISTSSWQDKQSLAILRQAHRLFSCPRFGHPCRREQTSETSSPYTAHGVPHIIRPYFQTAICFDPTP